MDIIKLSEDEYYMSLALKQAETAYSIGEVPVGAVAVYNGTVIGRAYNQVETLKDATAHAEILAITQASSTIGDWRLSDVTIYVTKEPCPMCAGAMVNAKLGSLCFGMSDSKFGGCGGAFDITNFETSLHRVNVRSGILSLECSEMFKNFFREVRQGKMRP